MGLRSGVVLRETEPGDCGIYLLTTASGNGFVGRYLLTTASGGIRRQIPPRPGSLWLAGWMVGFQCLIRRRIRLCPAPLWLTRGGPGFVIFFYFLEST